MASLERRQQRWNNRYRLPTACNAQQWDVVSDLIGAGRETMHTRLSRYISLFTQQLTSIARRRYGPRTVNALSDEWGTNLTPWSQSANRQRANSRRTYSTFQGVGLGNLSPPQAARCKCERHLHFMSTGSPVLVA